MDEDNKPAPPAGAPVVNVPPMPAMTRYEAIQISTEYAFNALTNEAKRLGVGIAPVMGLMYLPDEGVTRTFQQACRTVIDLLNPDPDA